MLNPIPGTLVVTSPFNAPREKRPHPGVDLRAAVGTPLVAVEDAVVVSVDEDAGGGEGRAVRYRDLRRGAQDHVWYACHLDSVAVQPGDRVAAGTLLGYTGASGEVTAQHLHLEARQVRWSGAPGDLVDAVAVLTGATEWAASDLVEVEIVGVDGVRKGLGVRLAPFPEQLEADDQPRRISPAERQQIRDDALSVVAAIGRATEDGQVTGRDVARIVARVVELAQSIAGAWRR